MSAQSTKPEPRDFTIRSVKAIMAHERTGAADTLLGISLTFVAGAINAGGFLAVGQYTSHMSGILSAMADNTALGSHWRVSGSRPSCPSSWEPPSRRC